MSGAEPAGVAFPVSADGRRSTSALGRAVVVDALSQVDPAGARAAEREKNWRSGYPAHFRGLVEAGLASKQAAVAVARGGLESLHRRMRFIGRDGQEAGLDTLVPAPAPARAVATVTVTGTGTAERELSVPYRGEQLHGTPCGAARNVGRGGCHRAILRGRHRDGRGAPGVAGPARPDDRGARRRR